MSALLKVPSSMPVFGFWEKAWNFPCSAGKLYRVWCRFLGILDFCMFCDGRLQGFYAWKLTCFCRFFFHFSNFVHFIPGNRRIFFQSKILHNCAGFLPGFFCAPLPGPLCASAVPIFNIIFLFDWVPCLLQRICREGKLALRWQGSAVKCKSNRVQVWRRTSNVHTQTWNMTEECCAPKVGMTVGMQIQQSAGHVTDT